MNWKSRLFAALLLCTLCTARNSGTLQAQAAGDKPTVALDEVTLKNGSRILGEVVQMTDGVLTIKNNFAAVDDVVKVKWEEIANLKTTKPIPVHLAQGSQLNGVIQGIQNNSLLVGIPGVESPTSVPFDEIKAVNPPPQKPYAVKFNTGLGASVSDGNTNNRTGSAFADLELRNDISRITIRGNYNYADNDSGVTLRNGLGAIKFDYFFTRRFYAYVSALFEHDGFQDLALRTALSAGPGYQFIDKGDFSGVNFRDMQLYGEVGISYFDEDHRRAKDDQYVAARWAIKWDWPILPKEVTLFHNHEGYPGLERGKDLYITTQQGVRFNIWQGLVATFQVNWKWDNTPTPGFERDDTLYLATLGYSVDI